ncbi:MAG: type II secretion system F family protein [Pigmentiphaga sp.]|nr:type II secretion system F family protein [Pigmentiphaga sp.]
MSAETVLVIALVLFALAALMVGVSLLGRDRRQSRAQARIDDWVRYREDPVVREAFDQVKRPGRLARVQALFGRSAEWGERLEKGRLAWWLMEKEDRQLLASAGFSNPALARGQYLFIRFSLMLALPVLVWSLGGESLAAKVMMAFAAFALGFLAPKWYLRSRVSARQKQAEQELPLLIDLLRLLQGVGLSVDQSLHVVVNDFKHVLPVLGAELGMAIHHYARGMSREQSLSRLATGFNNDDLSAIARLIVQVDRHGGAVQDPLRQFAERVREKRRMGLKERVSKLTVKMTAVMVVTLLPALLIVTGGAGFISIFRSMGRLGGL